MVKVYCDRCGKKLNTDDPHYYPLIEAANGDEIFFTVSVRNRKSPIHMDTGNKNVTIADLTGYDYSTPDLCPECMRAINQAVKTVWDGKKKDS